MAEEVTSPIVGYEIDGSLRIFRTITTHENSEVQKTLVQESISEQIYDQRISDGDSSLVAKDDNGLFYQTVLNDGANTKFTDINLEKSLAETGNNSFLSNLNSASIDALVDNTNEERSVWEDSYSQFNNIANASDANDGGGTLPRDTFNQDLNLGILSNIEIKADRRTSYENLRYPEYISSNQDRIVFTMFHQTGRNISLNLSSTNPFNLGTRKITNIDGSVTLPIQSGIEDRNEVGYTSSELNPITGAMAAVSMDPVGAAKQIMDVLNMNVEDIQKGIRSSAAQNVINALRVKMAEMAVGGSGLVPRTTGAILNPNLELLLNAPKLRTFQFNFKMSARSREEAIQIKKIIRFFKQGMSVKRSDKSLFIVSPNMFRIRYLTNISGVDVDHPSIGRVKNCALAALNTQYTPEGTYMTYDDPDRTMTSYNISMQFQELEPLTETDYLGTGPIAEGSEFRPAISINDIGY